MRTVKQILRDAGITQAVVAAGVGLSIPSVNILTNRGIWPARNPDRVRESLRGLLLDLELEPGLTPDEVEELLDTLGAHHDAQAAPSSYKRYGRLTPPSPSSPPSPPSPLSREGDDQTMYIRKQTLTPEARRAFGLLASPFPDTLPGPEGMFLSPDINYTRESMRLAVTNGGFLVVVGESGSGKSTLRRDLIHRCRREDLPVVFIEPYVLGMMGTDKSAGNALRASHIADAIIDTLPGGGKPQQSLDRKYRQVHQLLRASHESGNKHCLIIEEAHDLSYQTFKFLKRFFELEDGFTRLLSIILLGQTELATTMLNPTNALTREVVQRAEVLTLHPLDDLRGYIEHHLRLVGSSFDKVFGEDAVEAVMTTLSGNVAKGARAGRPLWYPLAVGNLLKAGINLAARLGESKVTGDCIRQAV